MRVVLIWPRGFETSLTLPLALGYLKSNIGQCHDVVIIDCALDDLAFNSPEFERRIRQFSPQVVGVSSWSTTYDEAINIIGIIKIIDARIVTVIGGIHPSMYSDSTMRNREIDFLCRGEAENSFPRLLDELSKTKPDFSIVPGLVYRVNNDKIIYNELVQEPNIDNIKIPDYDAIRIEDYIQLGYKYSSRKSRSAPIWITRGCPYRCNYCSAPIHNGRKIRSHSIDYAVEWVKYLYHNKQIRNINIIDDNFTFYPEFAKRFCEEIIKLNLKDLRFGTPNGIRMQRTDKELFRLMKYAGWKSVIIAPESGSINTLKRMKKDLDPGIVAEKVAEIKTEGLRAIGFFMVGYPGEDVEDIYKTRDLIRKCKFNYFFLFKFQPLPGTPIYQELLQQGQITSDFLPIPQFSGNTPFTPIGLQDFNFGLFQLREYTHLILTNPSSTIDLFQDYPQRFQLKSLLYNLKNSFDV